MRWFSRKEPVGAVLVEYAGVVYNTARNSVTSVREAAVDDQASPLDQPTWEGLCNSVAEYCFFYLYELFTRLCPHDTPGRQNAYAAVDFMANCIGVRIARDLHGNLAENEVARIAQMARSATHERLILYGRAGNKEVREKHGDTVPPARLLALQVARLFGRKGDDELCHIAANEALITVANASLLDLPAMVRRIVRAKW